jgi:hypothetical protein
VGQLWAANNAINQHGRLPHLYHAGQASELRGSAFESSRGQSTMLDIGQGERKGSRADFLCLYLTHIVLKTPNSTSQKTLGIHSNDQTLNAVYGNNHS